MEYFFNRIFYCVCNSWQYRFRLLLKNKNYREKLIEKKVIKVKSNGELDCSRFATILNGVMVPTTFGLLCVIFCIMILPIATLCIHIDFFPDIFAKILCYIIAFTPMIVLDCLIYRKDKYRHYFAIFDKDSPKKRWKWNIITILTLILAVIIAILLFKLNAFCFPKKST